MKNHVNQLAIKVNRIQIKFVFLQQLKYCRLIDRAIVAGFGKTFFQSLDYCNLVILFRYHPTASGRRPGDLVPIRFRLHVCQSSPFVLIHGPHTHSGHHSALAL